MSTARRLAQKFEDELIRISEQICQKSADDDNST